MYSSPLLPRTRRAVPRAGLVFDPFTTLHREMSRLFGDGSGAAGQRASAQGFAPALDITEADSAFRVAVELPGLDDKDVSVTLEDRVLVISGEKTTETEAEGREWHRRERTAGKFRRALSLPEDVDVDAIDARFAKGVLTVDLPRKAEAETGRKTIEVKPV